jgi:hypothetical protein
MGPILNKVIGPLDQEWSQKRSRFMRQIRVMICGIEKEGLESDLRCNLIKFSSKELLRHPTEFLGWG